MFTIGDKRVVFKYGYDSNRRPISTACYIMEGDKQVAQGVAYCNPVDQFARDTGRKLALGRALNPAFPRDERAQYWQAYLAARGGKW